MEARRGGNGGWTKARMAAFRASLPGLRIGLRRLLGGFFPVLFFLCPLGSLGLDLVLVGGLGIPGRIVLVFRLDPIHFGPHILDGRTEVGLRGSLSGTPSRGLATGNRQQDHRAADQQDGKERDFPTGAKDGETCMHSGTDRQSRPGLPVLQRKRQRREAGAFYPVRIRTTISEPLLFWQGFPRV